MSFEPDEAVLLDEEALTPVRVRTASRRLPARAEQPRWVARKRAARGEHVEYRRPARRIRHEVLGIILLVGGMLVLNAAYTPYASITAKLPAVLKAVLGALVGDVGSTIIAIGLIGIGGAMLFGHKGERVKFSATWLGILFLLFLALRQIQVPRDGFFTANRHWLEEPGGVIGLLLAEAIKPLLGRAWGTVVLVAGCLCCVIQMTEVRPGVLAQRTIRLLIAAAMFAIRLLLAGAIFLGHWIPAHLHRRSERLRLEKTAARSRRKAEAKPEPEAVVALVPAPPPVEEPVQPPVVVESAPAEQVAPEAVTETEIAADETVNEIPEPEIAVAHSDLSNYVLPPISLLTRSAAKQGNGEKEDAVNKMEILEQTLASFGIHAKVVEIERGPRVTRYEIRSPRGIRVSRITALADDIAYSLSALDVRVEAPVPGKGVIGIEVPNSEAVFVDLHEILSSLDPDKNISKLSFALGKDITGNPRLADLAKMPHLLIAGATNSGKSVCLNSMIASFLSLARPDELKLLLIDPKRVELSLFSGIPHLVAPVAHDVKQGAGLLRWAIREMEHRYEIFADLGVRNITGYNERAAMDEELEPMWFLVIVIDELADLMMQAKGEFEASICRIAQLARATGIHLVVATQRPSVNVITGTIKANISSRIAFAVASQADSRVILDMNGAERLVGSGDMLYLPIDEAKPARIQGAYISEKDIAKLVKHVKEQAAPAYSAAALAAKETGAMPGELDEVEDELFQKALDYVTSTKYASASMLQRRMRIGYTRAARLIDMMHERGHIGPADGSKPREVYVTPNPTGGQTGA